MNSIKNINDVKNKGISKAVFIAFALLMIIMTIMAVMQ
jgi:hypothetical protein